MLSTAPHCEVGPDNCFGCKARYWRDHGTPAVRWGGGYQTRAQWHDQPSVAARQAAKREECKAAGVDAEPVGTRWV